MLESSAASRQVMLLALLTGLFATAWSLDSGFTPPAHIRSAEAAPSAIAILMQTTSFQQPETAEPTTFGTNGGLCRFAAAQTRLAAATWLATTAYAGLPCEIDTLGCDVFRYDQPAAVEACCDAVYCQELTRSTAIVSQPVAAPVPVAADAMIAGTIVSLPVAAPIPDAAPLEGEALLPIVAGPPLAIRIPAAAREAVIAPIPLALGPAPAIVAQPVRAPVPDEADFDLARTLDDSPMFKTVSSRVRIDYRMTCHCCRDYMDAASRRVAAAQRQARQAIEELAASAVRSIRGIDWQTRLSAEPGDEATRRY